MKLEKAIEELTLFYNGYKSLPDPDLLEAAKLGSEALKRLQVMRSPEPSHPWPPLPGEDLE